MFVFGCISHDHLAWLSGKLPTDKTFPHNVFVFYWRELHQSPLELKESLVTRSQADSGAECLVFLFHGFQNVPLQEQLRRGGLTKLE